MLYVVIPFVLPVSLCVGCNPSAQTPNTNNHAKYCLYRHTMFPYSRRHDNASLPLHNLYHHRYFPNGTAHGNLDGRRYFPNKLPRSHTIQTRISMLSIACKPCTIIIHAQGCFCKRTTPSMLMLIPGTLQDPYVCHMRHHCSYHDQHMNL